MGRKKKTSTGENDKTIRQEVILKLIRENSVGTQQELAQELIASGYEVTQATVSRDIKELNLTKKPLSGGGYRYEVQQDKNFRGSDKFHNLYTSAVLRVDSVLNQVVIHCYTGMASAICAALDGMGFEGILGTIAGDDTILIICHDEPSAVSLSRKLREI